MANERSNMIVRNVKVDFADAKINWLPNDPQHAQYWNAQSLGLPFTEAFLVRTMKKATDLIPEHDAAMRKEVELFCAQEVNHYQTHKRFNDKVKATGHYPRIDEFLDKMKDDYKQFEEKRGLRFCMHYVEGFETSGPIVAGYFIEQSMKHIAKGGVDPVTVSLWQWHLSEEFEHRCVAFNMVEALYGSYWERIQGIFFAGNHLIGFGMALSNYMLAEDVKAGRLKGGLPSLLSKIRSYGAMFAYAIPRYLLTLSPWYNPARLKAPKGTWQILDIASETLSINKLAEHIAKS